MFLKLAKLSLFVSVFNVAIVLSGTYFPFIGGKYFFFRITVELALAAVVFWWAFEGGDLGRRLKRVGTKPIFIAVSVFALMFLLASFFAFDPKGAFWSNFERGEGGFQMIHYYLFFVLLLVVLESAKDWRILFWCSVVAAGLMIMYGILAALLVPGYIGPYFGPDGQPTRPSFWERLFGTIRFQGSLGNPAYVAPYLVFSMFYALWLWLSKPQSKRRLLGYGALLLSLFIFFILAQTRGAFLGLVAGVMVYLGWLIWLDKGRLRKTALIVLGSLVILGSILFAFRESTLIQNIPGGRLLNINLGEQTANTRFWTWNSAWQGFLDRPLLGWGPENFSSVFDRYFDSRHFVPGVDTETWFDRAHNVIFDYLAETGILGFLAYLGVLMVWAWEIFRSRVKIGSLTRSGLLLSLLVAYVVQALILFDVLPIFMNTLIALAFVQFSTNHS